MFDELWSEIEDMPGEIFDMNDETVEQFIEEQKFDFNSYLNANYDY